MNQGSADAARKQQEQLAEKTKDFDVVITTALVPGRAAPRLVTKETVAGMRPGSVIVDLAAEAGGNCELTEPNSSPRATIPDPSRGAVL
jgi:NAD(P) transhydrogenase subunit alpha